MIVGKGFIERIDENNVGWGRIKENDQTFDLPVYDHKVGDEVLFLVPGPDDDESNYDCAYGLANDTKLTLLFCEETEEGFEIMDVQVFPRTGH
jgi:hypothetical protein